MLCDNCLHKNVCKHKEHFKEYEKQYIEMRKKCSLFDPPIECSCYTKEEVFNKNEIHNVEVVKDYLKTYFKNNLSFMDNVQMVAFNLMDELLESHIEKLKIITLKSE